MLKPHILKALRTVSSPHRNPCHKPFIDLSQVEGVGPLTVGVSSGIMESLESGKGLIRERWCCARDWLMIAVLTGDKCKLAFDAFKVVENAELVPREETLGRELR